MSGILDNVLGSLMQDQVTGKMADSFGIEKDKTQSALATAMPILLQALNRNASTVEGRESLERALQKDHSPEILNNPQSYLENPKVDEGSKILDHILGNKRNTVEQFISKDSGLSSSLVGNLLSAAAPMIMGALAGKQQQSNEGIGGILSGITNEINQKGSGNEQSLIEKLLDQDNDGSIVDDVTDMGKSLLGNMFK